VGFDCPTFESNEPYTLFINPCVYVLLGLPFLPFLAATREITSKQATHWERPLLCVGE
jgi:hypothetical protein